MAYLYRHIRLDKNEPFYIGIGSDIDGKYSRAHNKMRSIHWKRIVSKTDYEVEIMLDDLTWEEACKKEKEFIKLYGRKDLKEGTLVNMTDGGDGHINPTEETRKKLSIIHKGKILSKETKEKIRHFNLGKTLSDNAKRKLSESTKGKHHSKIMCPHCNKSGGDNTMRRWHFDNCKNKK